MMGHAAVLSWEGGVGLDSDVARLRRGDPQALEALLSRYQHRLYRYLLRLVREPALADLPVIYREILSLRFEEEMKLEEIAGVLELPLSTVKTRLRRGLEGMKRKMETRSPGQWGLA